MAGATATSDLAPPPVSFLQRSRLRLTALLALPLAALSMVSALGTLLAPHLLVDYPLLLIALSPRRAYLAVAAATVPLPLFLAVGFLRLVAADPWHFLLGRVHGATVAEGLARRCSPAGRLAGRLLHSGQPGILTAVALWPTGKMLMIAGVAGLPPRRVALADAGGTLVQLVAIHALGVVMGRLLEPSERTLALVGVAAALFAVAGSAAVAAGVRKGSAFRNRLTTVPPVATFAP